MRRPILNPDCLKIKLLTRNRLAAQRSYENKKRILISKNDKIRKKKPLNTFIKSEIENISKLKPINLSDWMFLLIHKSHLFERSYINNTKYILTNECNNNNCIETRKENKNSKNIIKTTNKINEFTKQSVNSIINPSLYTID